MHKEQFTENEIELLKSLFQEKETASSSKQKSIRAKMRKIGFYITDYYGKMNLSDFERLVKSWKENSSNDSEGNCSKRLCMKEEHNHSHVGCNEAPASNSKKGLDPWVGETPIVLILGTLPSDKSIKSGLYYQNPTNRFWKIIHTLFGGSPNDKSKEFLFKNKIALWDCLQFAQRKGSTDSRIVKGSEIPNDISKFLKENPTIEYIILNGFSKTKFYFDKFNIDLYNEYKVICLPQTSKMNETGKNKITFEEKLFKWRILKEILNA